jgi:cbb3-type cytochrome oxidase subunit 3
MNNEYLFTGIFFIAYASLLFWAYKTAKKESEEEFF